MRKEITTNQSFHGAGGTEMFPNLKYIAMVEEISPRGGDGQWYFTKTANEALLEKARKMEGIGQPSVFGIEYIRNRHDVLVGAYGNVYAKRISD